MTSVKQGSKSNVTILTTLTTNTYKIVMNYGNASPVPIHFANFTGNDNTISNETKF